VYTYRKAVKPYVYTWSAVNHLFLIPVFSSNDCRRISAQSQIANTSESESKFLGCLEELKLNACGSH
jgi:hypothetical protein